MQNKSLSLADRDHFSKSFDRQTLWSLMVLQMKFLRNYVRMTQKHLEIVEKDTQALECYILSR